MLLLNILSFIAIPMTAAYAASIPSSNSTSPIVTTKVTPSYWRATFSSPPFNLQDTAWYTSFYSLVNEIENDPDVKVVVFDSNVENFYIAHFDIINGVSQELTDGYWGNMTRLANLPVLTIAAVRGIARGGGVEFTAGLDVTFGSKEKAVFGQIEVGAGILPGNGGMTLLSRHVGRSRTLEIVLGAEDFDADTAAQYGWINRAVADASFDTFVDAYARRVSSFDHYAIAAAKRIINKRTGYPTVQEQQEDWQEFLGAASQPLVQRRIAKFIEMGMQTDLDFELNADQKIMELVGPGPWET